MAAEMAAVSANSTSGIAEAEPDKIAAKMAAVSVNCMVGKFSGKVFVFCRKACCSCFRCEAVI